MKKNILMKIRTEQHLPDDESETMELQTPGTMTQHPDCLEFTYEETQMTGLMGVRTSFFLYGKERVILQRSGKELNSRMDFRLGQRDDSLYDVGVGALLLSVTATRMCIEPEQGFFELEYDVEVEHSVKGTNLCHVEFSETE